jgi:hypothetical protein
MDKPVLQNVHVRRLNASIDRVRPWIEACWSAGDRDCFPRDVIPNWRKNRPGTDPQALIPGETMIGHGPFRFRLRSWDGYRWRVDVVGSLSGWHGFDLLADGDGCRLTHTIELAGSLSTRVAWMTIAPVHDWAVEAMFDRLERALATGVVPAHSERPMSRMAAFALGLARLGSFRAAGKRAARKRKLG